MNKKRMGKIRATMQNRDIKDKVMALRRLCRYGLVGLSGVVVNVLAFELLRNWSHFGLTTSSAIAAELAIISNFIWNDNWTFKDVSIQQKGWALKLRRFFSFNIVCLFGLVFNVVAVNFLVKFLYLAETAAVLIAIVFVITWNYMMNIRFSWRSIHNEQRL